MQDFQRKLKFLPSVLDGQCVFDSYDDNEETEEPNFNSSENKVDKIRLLLYKIRRSEQLTIKLGKYVKRKSSVMNFPQS